MYSSLKEFLVFREEEGILDLRREDAYRYAGPRALIASALSFRLMQEAIKDLSPNDIPERRAFYIISGHSGPGVKDCFEFFTRAVSEGRYIFDPSKAPSCAPPSAAGGYMFFEIGYKSKAIRYSISPKILGNLWFDAVKKHQEGSASIEEHQEYLALKTKIAGDLLMLPNIFNIRTECDFDRRF